MQNSLLASAGKGLWRLLEAKGIDADALFRKFDLDPALIREPRARYPHDQLSKAWTEAALICNNEHIGLHAAEYFTPLDLNAIGVTFLSSSTLLEALQRLDRYETFINSNLDFTLVENGQRLDFLSELQGLDGENTRVIEDCRLSVLVKLARTGLDNALDPVEVAFTYPEPPAIGEHFGVFRCPLVFSQPVARISFAIADTHRPFTDANRELALSNDRFLDEMMNELKSPDLVTQVKRAIMDDLPSGTPSEEQVAAQVCVSSRTLQRRLAEDGTSFRALVLEVRRQLAEKYISDKTMPLAEISYMLGFADTSSFSRAFKKWTGDPPAIFRSNLTG